jgi:radical SAM protein with 4Fe4S-binding SPASM domain
MKKIAYKTFSGHAHEKIRRIKRVSVCQFELTFKCGLHCSYCYAACYNKPGFIRRELDTRQVKVALDKLYRLGVIWLCFTGGDPLERSDFLDIYLYARRKGFLITLFTTGYSMTEEVVDCLKKCPPFVVELTLNSAEKETYERISGVKGSYERTMRGLAMITGGRIPLKVKTMAFRQNYDDLAATRKFLEARGIAFRPDFVLLAGLGGDTRPCRLRLDADEIAKVNASVLAAHDPVPSRRLFRCALGCGDGINIDPYGNMFPCLCIREPSFSFLEAGADKIKDQLLRAFPLIARAEFSTASECRECRLRSRCLACPGKALLETGDREAPIGYFCGLAKYAAGVKNRGKREVK